MAKYDGVVVVRVTTTYQIRLDCEAENEAEATGKLAWQAMGLEARQIIALAEQPEGENHGSEVTVDTVWGVDTVPTSIRDF